jgi:hypothetical protein
MPRQRAQVRRRHASASRHPGVEFTALRHADGRAAGHCARELSTSSDEARPPPVDALMVVLEVLTAVALAVPVPSVGAVDGVIVPAPILNATVTFGTARPLALSTRADTVNCWLKPELAVRTRLAGAVDGLGPRGGGGGSTPPHAGRSSAAARITLLDRHRRPTAFRRVCRCRDVMARRPANGVLEPPAKDHRMR